MSEQVTIERLEKMLRNRLMGKEDKYAIQTALEALRGNPCSVCIYSPPSAGDGRPCTYCPATGKVIE